MLVPLLTAQSVPFTDAQPPRKTELDVVKPLVALIVPVGWVKLTVAPTLRVIVPSETRSGLAVALAVSEIALAPGLSVVLANVWLFVVEALPTRFSVPPPSSLSDFSKPVGLKKPGG